MSSDYNSLVEYQSKNPLWVRITNFTNNQRHIEDFIKRFSNNEDSITTWNPTHVFIIFIVIVIVCVLTYGLLKIAYFVWWSYGPNDPNGNTASAEGQHTTTNRVRNEAFDLPPSYDEPPPYHTAVKSV